MVLRTRARSSAYNQTDGKANCATSMLFAPLSVKSGLRLNWFLLLMVFIPYFTYCRFGRMCTLPRSMKIGNNSHSYQRVLQ